MTRRQHLKESKYFECQCKRCADPTEFNSNFSTLKCLSCKGNVTSLDSLNSESEWQCNSCSKRMTSVEVDSILKDLNEENLNPDLQSQQKHLKKLRQFLHENHSFVVDIKFNISAILCSRLLPDPDKMREEAILKQKICIELLDVMNLLIPGSFRLRGLMLLELASATFFLLFRDKSESSLVSVVELVSMLEESQRILEWEPPQTHEGRRAVLARRYKDKVLQLIDS